MPIDKSWTKIRNRVDPLFTAGLNSFIERCKNHLDRDGKCQCPCIKCGNLRSQTIPLVKLHIGKNGFDTSYKWWTNHGEDLPQPVVYNDENPLVNLMYDIRGENMTFAEAVDEEMDVDETGGDDDTTGGPSFGVDDIIKDKDTELWGGCTWMTSLQFMAQLSYLKVYHKCTNAFFDQLLALLKNAFPKDNKIPSSYYQTKKWMKTFDLGYQSIHACVNDCSLFWKENEKLDKCGICGASRWKDKDTVGKKVPQKVMRYFPVTPRLKRLYNNRLTAPSMIWHATGQSKIEGKMRHPVDGKSWKEFDKRYPDFAREPRNVRLGLASDGFNPFGNMSSSYSMWPVILTSYNMPPWLCMKEHNLMLALLIPGPKSPGKDIDVYLRPLVDELKMLWSEGVHTKDSVTNTYFTMKAMLLWTINDFPARSSLSGWSGQGYKACPTCNEDTPSTRVIGKTAYVGHRKFLPMNDPRRSDLHFNGERETGKVRKFSVGAITTQLEQLLPIGNPGKNHDNNSEGNKKKSL